MLKKNKMNKKNHLKWGDKTETPNQKERRDLQRVLNEIEVNNYQTQSSK